MSSRRQLNAAAWLLFAGLSAGLLGGWACSGSATQKPRAIATLKVEKLSSQATSGASAVQSCTRRRPAAGGPQALSDGASSTVALGDWNGQILAFVADVDSRAFHVVDVDARTVLSTNALPGVPGQLLLLVDGRLVLSLPYRSELQVFEPGADASTAFEHRCTINTAAEPVAMAPDAKHEAVLVLSAWGQAVTAYAASTFAKRYQVELPREPRAIALSDDGNTAFIAHAVGAEASAFDLATKQRHGIPLGKVDNYRLNELRKEIKQNVQNAGANPTSEALKQAVAAAYESKFGNNSERRDAAQGFAIVPSAHPRGRMFVPYVFVESGSRYSSTTYRFGTDNGATHVPTIAVIDQRTGYPLPSSLSSDYRQSYRNVGEQDEFCLLPRAAVLDPHSNALLVACLGIDTVIAFDAASARPAEAEKRRWRVAAGPTGIALDPVEKRAVVWSQFARTLNVFPLTGPTLEADEGAHDKAVRHVKITTGESSPEALLTRLGRALFYTTNDSRISAGGIACASCHPNGRDDGAVWTTPQGSRRTIMLAGRLTGTAPYSWEGKNHDLAAQLAEIYKRLGGVGGLRGIRRQALIAYLRSLKPPPRAAPASNAVATGRELFLGKQQGCASCHRGKHFTDNELHDVKSKEQNDRATRFNTPSLEFVSGRAPYVHDGRYESIEKLLSDDKISMGKTAHLSPAEREALAAFVKSL